MRLVLREHESFHRWSRPERPAKDDRRRHLPAPLYDRLKRFDQHGRPESDRVFDWRDDRASTRQWVGVVEVSGLQVEILPKVDDPAATRRTPTATVRENLLYMLAVGGKIPLRERDLALLRTRRAPLSEALAAIFAERLLTELLKGPARAYVVREDDLRRFKGKLDVTAQIRRNPAHRERFACRFDEFSADTLLNRLLRSAVRTLLETSAVASTQDHLRRSLAQLDDVSDEAVRDEDFDRIALTRPDGRFAELLAFARLILAGRSPDLASGRERSFSLLFDMNVVFESFIAGFLRRHVMPELPGYRLHVQAKGQRRHLLLTNGCGTLALRPDLMIVTPGGERIVIDTKWKSHPGDSATCSFGAADLYQMYAYIRRFACRTAILLAPRRGTEVNESHDLIDHADSLTGETLVVRRVDLRANLSRESGRRLLSEELLGTVVLEQLQR